MQWHRTSRGWIWLALIAFMVTRLVDAHLHLCFDGQEPPAAVHMTDGAGHDDSHHVDSQHQDRDVQMLDTALVKKVGESADVLIPAFLAAVFLLLLFDVRGRLWLRSNDAPPILRALHSLKPPLRGPPL